MAFGMHFGDTYAGRVFYQPATPLGLAIPIYTATAIAGGMPIWNPPGSNVYVELLQYNFVYASGTADFGAIGLMGLFLNSIGTGTPCTAAAWTAPLNGFLGAGAAAKTKSSNAGTVTVTAGTAAAPSDTTPGWLRSLASFNLEAATGTAHATDSQTYKFDGTLIIPEGYMVYVTATKASVALYATTVVWKEIPT